MDVVKQLVETRSSPQDRIRSSSSYVAMLCSYVLCSDYSIAFAATQDLDYLPIEDITEIEGRHGDRRGSFSQVQ